MDEDVIIWKMEMLMICEFLFVIWLCVVGYLFYRCIEMLCKFMEYLDLIFLEFVKKLKIVKFGKDKYVNL